MNPRVIAKSLIATLTALGTWGGTALADGSITGPEWFGLCGVAVVGLSTWAKSNHAPVRRNEER